MFLFFWLLILAPEEHRTALMKIRKHDNDDAAATTPPLDSLVHLVIFQVTISYLLLQLLACFLYILLEFDEIVYQVDFSSYNFFCVHEEGSHVRLDSALFIILALSFIGYNDVYAREALVTIHGILSWYFAGYFFGGLIWMFTPSCLNCDGVRFYLTRMQDE